MDEIEKKEVYEKLKEFLMNDEDKELFNHIKEYLKTHTITDLMRIVIFSCDEKEEK